MNEVSRAKARVAGWESFHAGVMLHANPFLQGSDLHRAWVNGWHRASKGYLKPQPEFKQ